MKIQHFMIDPPWPLHRFGIEKFKHLEASRKYKTVSVSDIFDLIDQEIFTQAAKQHHVYMWTIDKFLLETEFEMEKRGYRRHVRIIWDKKRGMGAPSLMLQIHHEYLIWYYKPRLIVSRSMLKNGTIIHEASREHSRKPDSAYSLIERLYPNQSYMDVFSRQSREGWKQFGNEKNYFPSFEKVLKI